MALEDILKKIRDDAQSQAGDIKKNALAEREKILAEAREKASRERKVILENAMRDAELEAQRIITLASLDSRKEILSTKQELINECFNKAVSELSSMDSESYYKLLKQMLFNHLDKNEPKQTLIISKNDKNRIDAKQLVEDVNLALKEKGIKTRIHLCPEYGSFSGGFLLQSSSNNIKNLSWDIIFRIKRPDWEPEVSRILFEG